MVEKPRVALFVTCLVDLYRPNIGFACAKLLEQAGCSVAVPKHQTCCGQPTYNNGDLRDTQMIARQVIEAFEGYDYIVAPSASCAGMLKVHYPSVFKRDPLWQPRAERFAGKSHELLSFLSDVVGVIDTNAHYDGTVTYHDSCSSLRELKVKRQPRQLLQKVRGLSISELRDTEVCCGFGGTFCVKYPEISTRMVSDKAANVDQSGAGTLVAADLGCLLNIAGRLKRLGSPVKVFHVAEVLAGMTNVPSIGEGVED